MEGPTVHTPRDGRGPRRVLLDGREIRNVIYADTERGIVRFHEEPLCVVGEEIVSRELKGKVEVEPCPE